MSNDELDSKDSDQTRKEIFIPAVDPKKSDIKSRIKKKYEKYFQYFIRFWNSLPKDITYAVRFCVYRLRFRKKEHDIALKELINSRGESSKALDMLIEHAIGRRLPSKTVFPWEK